MKCRRGVAWPGRCHPSGGREGVPDFAVDHGSTSWWTEMAALELLRGGASWPEMEAAVVALVLAEATQVLGCGGASLGRGGRRWRYVRWGRARGCVRGGGE